MSKVEDEMSERKNGMGIHINEKDIVDLINGIQAEEADEQDLSYFDWAWFAVAVPVGLAVWGVIIYLLLDLMSSSILGCSIGSWI